MSENQKQDESAVEFGVFDRQAQTDQHLRKLPHWFQPNVATFITFRTKDSMPKAVIKAWREEISQWLLQKGLENSDEWDELPGVDSIPQNLRAKFYKLKSQGWHRRLDQCHGNCVLRDPALALIVSDTLKFFDGDRYDLASFIVMPNHVHVLVQFRHNVSLAKQTESWLRFSARQINEQLNQTGPFWQSKPFDHLVRSNEQFEYLLDYIRSNPKKAGLKEGEYLLHERK